MSDTAIRVQNLSKQYRIGGPRGQYKTFRETIVNAATSPIRRLRQRQNGSNGAETIWALKDVSFEVKRGEVVGIIGRNGAGKSTLLKILSRITKPTQGRAEVYGRVGSLLEVGTGFHSELTGRENIYLNGAILGMRKEEIEHKFDEIVAFAEIEKFLDTPVKHYSSGMYVRLAFAVAAHLEPEILLVDEVLAVGDAAFQKKCLGKMGEVAKQGRTVLFVSHNMSAIVELCGRALLIQRGRIVGDGCAEDIIGKYLHDASVSENGNFDLSNHSARLPRYRPIIQRMTLRGDDGIPTSFFYPDACMQIDIVVKSPHPVREPRLAVAVEDNVGRRIMTAASYFQPEQLKDLVGTMCVRCTLPKLNLGEGRYLLSVSLAQKSSGLLDSVDQAAWFEVGWRNNYGNGEPFSLWYGPVLSTSAWECLEPVVPAKLQERAEELE